MLVVTGGGGFIGSALVWALNDAGHADIVRELIDGAVGLRNGNGNMAPGDQAWWENYRSRLEQVAREAGPG